MPEVSLTASRNLAGIALMTAGMASAAAVDAVIKAMSGLVDIFVITTVVGCGMAMMFGIATITSGARISLRDLVHRTVLFRTVCEVVGVYLIVLALSLVSLGEVTALSQTLPLLVTLGAVIFLGERAGPFEWLALFAGLVGMLLIVQPATDGFEPALLIALASAIVLAARDLASRAVPSSISTAQLGFWGGSALGVFSFTMVLSTDQSPPSMSWTITGGFLLIIILSSATFYGVTAAMRVGSVAVISPFRYARLPFGIFLGIALFSESIDLAAVLGSAIIVLSGLAIWWRELKFSP